MISIDVKNGGRKAVFLSIPCLSMLAVQYIQQVYIYSKHFTTSIFQILVSRSAVILPDVVMVC